jgi:hypothetical protein
LIAESACVMQASFCGPSDAQSVWKSGEATRFARGSRSFAGVLLVWLATCTVGEADEAVAAAVGIADAIVVVAVRASTTLPSLVERCCFMRVCQVSGDLRRVDAE